MHIFKYHIWYSVYLYFLYFIQNYCIFDQMIFKNFKTINNTFFIKKKTFLQGNYYFKKK